MNWIAYLIFSLRTGRFATAGDAVREAVSFRVEHKRQSAGPKASGKKSLAQLFAESPLKGMDIEFPRDKDPLRSVDL